MNPFERHGIRNLSPSSLNLYAANPSLWVGKYLFKWKEELGASAARGTAVETGLDYWLFQRDAKRAEEIALANFADRTGGQCDEEHDAERKNIAPMLAQAMEATKDFPTPVARQVKLSYFANGIEVPLIGYVDYGMPDFDFDLKTSKQCPSDLGNKPDHCRQFALYRAARNKPQKALYVTPKKHALFTLGDNEASMHLRDLERQASAVRHLLARSTDAQDAAKFFAPVFDDFRWSDMTTNLANELWRAA